MVGDNDAGGVSTYAQAGQNFGYSLAVDAAAADPGPGRHPGDGRAPRRGHRRGPRPADSRALRPFWGASRSRPFPSRTSSSSSPSSSAFACARLLRREPLPSVPLAVAVLFAVTASGTFRRWERFMLLFIAVTSSSSPWDPGHPLGRCPRRSSRRTSRAARLRPRCCSSSPSSARRSRPGSCSSSSPTSSTSASRRAG